MPGLAVGIADDGAFALRRNWMAIASGTRGL